MDMDNKLQICKIVAQAIVSDAQITDAEKEFLNATMDRYSLNEDQRKIVMATNIDDDPGTLAKDLTEYTTKNELLVELALAVAADGKISPSERSIMNKVAAALNVDTAELDMLVKNALM